MLVKKVGMKSRERECSDNGQGETKGRVGEAVGIGAGGEVIG